MMRPLAYLSDDSLGQLVSMALQVVLRRAGAACNVKALIATHGYAVFPAAIWELVDEYKLRHTRV